MFSVTTHQRNEECYTGINIPERLLEAAKECGITDERVISLVRNNAADPAFVADFPG